MDEHCRVATVVNNDIGPHSLAPIQNLVGVPPVLLQRLALDGKHRGAGSRDGGSCMILRGVDVATGPSYRCTERLKRFNQNGRLDGHMKGACNAGAFQGLLFLVLFTQGHQPGHFLFSKGYLLASKFG